MQNTHDFYDKYQQILNSTDEGFFLIDVIFDDDDNPIDMYYVEANEAATKMLGADYTGKRLREIDPNYEEYWYEIFGKVALTGESVRMEQYAEPDKRWYSFHLFKIGDENSRRIVNIFLDITERKKKEKTLRESEQMYRTLLDNTEDGFVLVEPIFAENGEFDDYRILAVNALWERQTGLKAADFAGKRIREAMPQVEPSRPANFAEVARTGTSKRFESYNAESSRWYDIHAFLYREGQVGVLFRDITERKKAEEALRRSEASFRAFVTASSDVVYRMSPDWSKMNFLQGRDFIPDTCSPDKTWINRYIHPDDQPQVLRVINEAIRTKSIFEMEHRVRRVDGTLGWTYSRAVPLIDDGEITEWLGTAKDITESKRAEKDLQDYRLHLEELVRERTGQLEEAVGQKLDLLESISDCFYSLDGDLRFTYVNKGAEKVWGLSRDELIGKKIEEIFPGAIDTSLGKFRQVLMEKEPAYYELRSNVSQSWVSMRVYPTQAGISVFWHDITQRKQFENEISRLDRLNLIGEMAAGIGHEIRNPMTSVRGFLQMISSNDKYQEERDFFNLMIEELDRANGIITEYLGMAKDKRIDLQPQSIDHLITALYPMIMSDANLRGINVHLDLNHPPQPLIDSNEIRQLILNMVRNGMEAMAEHGTLTIGTGLEDDQAFIYIKDEGHGLQPNAIEKLGTPFFTTKNNGTGLGLAVCYSIAARHKARIVFDTSPAGTTFYVRFPAVSG